MQVPNLPIDPIIDKEGLLTAVGKNFFETLIGQLVQNFSNEGLVAPTQNGTNITTIQNNKNGQGQYTCAYGTLVYNVTTNNLMVAVNNGSNQPVFLNIITSASDAFLLL